MTTAPADRKRRSPLLYLAVFLSTASLAWTTWSLVDLLGAGLIGITVAVGADVIWASVIRAEYRRLRLAGHAWIVPALGWGALLIVAGLLAWHGLDRGNLAMAVAGPFLPFGAKVVWTLALADMRDPAALTESDLQTLADMERGMAFEEAQHRIEMRRREMNAELQIAEVSTDFDIEVMRQDKSRELVRRRPLELTTGGAAPHDAPHRIEAPHTTDAHHGADLYAPAHVMRARTGTADEVADGTRDAPQMPAAPVRVAAPHGGGAALHFDGLSKAAAVRAVRDALPAASAPQIVERLAHHGIDATDAYVRTVLSRDKQQRTTTDGGYL